MNLHAYLFMLSCEGSDLFHTYDHNTGCRRRDGETQLVSNIEYTAHNSQPSGLSLHHRKYVLTSLFVISLNFQLLSKVSNDYNLLVEGIVLAVSIAIALVVLFTSVSDTPPVYHWVFAYFGILGICRLDLCVGQ